MKLWSLMYLKCSSVFVYPQGFIYSRAPDTLGRWRGWKWFMLVHGAVQHCQSLPWKHMADRQARWVTILTWHWLTHVGKGRCEKKGRRGHRSTRLCQQTLPVPPHPHGQETSATMPPTNPNPPPPPPEGMASLNACHRCTLPPVQTWRTNWE